MNYNHVINHRWSEKLYFSILIFFALVQTILAITFFGEDFNSNWSTTNPPPGWRIAFTGDTAINDWHRKDALSSPWFNNLTSYACLFGDPITGDAPDSLISVIINCSNYHNIVLRCSTYFIPLGGVYRAALYGSIDGGATWPYEIRNYTNQFIPPQLLTDEVSWALNQTQVRFLWVYEGDPLALAYWCIDDFSLTGSAVHDTDIAILKIERPKCFEFPGTIPLRALFANVGNLTQYNIPVTATIYHVPDTFPGQEIILVSDIIDSINPFDTVVYNFSVFPCIDSFSFYLAKDWCDATDDQDRSNDTLSKNFKVGLKNELGYDDGISVSDSSWVWERYGWGVKFINELCPIYPALVESLKFHLSVQDTLSNHFRIRICDDDGIEGGPGTPIYESGILTAVSGWNSFNLLPDSLAIWDSSFYIFFIQIEGQPLSPKLSRDAARNIEASYWACFDTVYVQDFTPGDWMIRCLLNYQFEYPRPNSDDFRTVYIGSPEENIIVRPPNRNFIPKARIENWGSQPQLNVPVVCSIISITNPSIAPYVSTKIVSLNPGTSTFLNFDVWAPAFRIQGRIKVRTLLQTDMNISNDAKEETIFVHPSFFTGRDFSIYDYHWIDSDTTGGPNYSWIDTSGWFWRDLQGDENVFVMPETVFGLNFRFYDTTYRTIWVSDNGWIRLGPDTGFAPPGYPNNYSIPDTLMPNNTIYAFWDDLAFGPLYGGGGVFYKKVGVAPNRKFIVIYQDVLRKDAVSNDPITFEVILTENNTILLQYQDVFCSDARFNYGRSATVGIEDSSGTFGLQYLYGEGGTSSHYPGNKLSGGRAIKIYSSFIGIEEEQTQQSINPLSLKIYPNPARSFLAIRLPSIAYRQMIKIFDVSGKMIRDIATLPSVIASQSIGTRSALRNDNEIKISLKGINPGIYFLRFGKETKKFLVVK